MSKYVNISKGNGRIDDQITELIIFYGDSNPPKGSRRMGARLDGVESGRIGLPGLG